MEFTVTEEQLQALESDYMTKDAIVIITNEIRTCQKDDTQKEKELRASTLKRIYRWIEYNNDGDNLAQDKWEANRAAYQTVVAKLESMQRELFPGLNVYKYNNLPRDKPVEECLE